MEHSSKVSRFADILVNYSAQVEEDDYVYLTCSSLDSLPLYKAVRKEVIKQGGFPHEHLLHDSQIGAGGMDYTWMKHASRKQLKTQSEAKKKEIEEMDAYIRIGGGDNNQQLSNIDTEKSSIRKKATKEIMTERLKKDWVVTCYPTDSLAQSAGMATEEFKEFVFDSVVELDFEELKEKNEKVKEVFDDTQEVQILGEDTDLTMSLRDRDGIPDNGECNIPCGEVFYAPRRESLEGHIKFTYPAVRGGNEVKGVYLEFEGGEVVNFSAEENEEFLEKMLNTDEGAKRVGELGLGTNRMIDEYVKSTLFDEKIGGTIHLALGRAYEECVVDESVRNDSGIHWDIVKDLRERAGGGKILADREVVQQDGEWTFL
jgi:aminopeptidase